MGFSEDCKVCTASSMSPTQIVKNERAFDFFTQSINNSGTGNGTMTVTITPTNATNVVIVYAVATGVANGSGTTNINLTRAGVNIGTDSIVNGHDQVCTTTVVAVATDVSILGESFSAVATATGVSGSLTVTGIIGYVVLEA
jgi:hypothetical protein